MPFPLKRQRNMAWGLFSPILWRILAVNIIALLLLGAGILYLDQFRSDLIAQKVRNLQIQAEIIAGAIGESPSLGPESRSIDTEPSRRIIRRLVGPTENRARLFAADGSLVADSRFLSPVQSVYVTPLPPPDQGGEPQAIALDWLNTLIELVSPSPPRPIYRERPTQTAFDYEEVAAALGGERGLRIRQIENGPLHISVAVPIQRFRRVLGTLMLSADTADIQALLENERLRFLKVFGVVFGLTLLLSIFLAGTIARPIRRLARAADKVRQAIGRSQALETFTSRRDEIGLLSRSLSSMTESLYRQIDAMAQFAADVAHELKNPLTSIRSAVDTMNRAQDPKIQKELLDIIQDDLKRLDRLISDISDASRLDAELSRGRMEEIDLVKLVESMTEAYEVTTKKNIRFAVESPDKGKAVVHGIRDRIMQVLHNIIDNAISFSPDGSTVTIVIEKAGNDWELRIDDEGPGLPEGGSEKIFDRFYSERDTEVSFGKHSGLGLSISKQIVEAHNGHIFARNRKDDETDKILGACFVLRFPRA